MKTKPTRFNYKLIMEAILTSAVVGHIITFVNQYPALFGSESFRWMSYGFSFCIPIAVFSFGVWRSGRNITHAG